LIFIEANLHKTIKDDIRQILSNNLPWDNFHNKTVLITGGAGMIGTYLVYSLLELNRLQDTNIKIIVLDVAEEKMQKNFTECVGEIDLKQFTLIHHDILEPLVNIEALKNERIDVVFHGATRVGPKWYNSDPTLVLLTEVIGTKNVLDLCPKQLVLESTSVVYGAWNNDRVVTEQDLGYIDTTKKSAAYAEGKRAAEALALTFKHNNSPQSAARIQIARIAQSIGPYMPLGEAGAGADFITNALNCQDIVMRTNGESKRAFTYIADSVVALFFIVLKGEDKNIYNVNNMHNYISVRELAETVVDAVSEKNLRVVLNPEMNKLEVPEMNGICLDTAKLENLGWTAQIAPYEMVKRTLDFYKGNNP
jgi:nucleoside-diphosphate-sugar epimerase